MYRVSIMCIYTEHGEREKHNMMMIQRRWWWWCPAQEREKERRTPKNSPTLLLFFSPLEWWCCVPKQRASSSGKENVSSWLDGTRRRRERTSICPNVWAHHHHHRSMQCSRSPKTRIECFPQCFTPSLALATVCAVGKCLIGFRLCAGEKQREENTQYGEKSKSPCDAEWIANIQCVRIPRARLLLKTRTQSKRSAHHFIIIIIVIVSRENFDSSTSGTANRSGRDSHSLNIQLAPPKRFASLSHLLACAVQVSRRLRQFYSSLCDIHHICTVQIQLTTLV